MVLVDSLLTASSRQDFGQRDSRHGCKLDSIDGIDLANVARIAIGFGDGTTSRAGGAGVVYFDDIGLYR